MDGRKKRETELKRRDCKAKQKRNEEKNSEHCGAQARDRERERERGRQKEKKDKKRVSERVFSSLLSKRCAEFRTAEALLRLLLYGR